MKVLLVATVQSHICQFHKPLVRVLHHHGAEVHVAAKDNLAEKNGLALDFADKVYNVPFARSPKSPDNLKAYHQLKKIIDAGGYDVVHCNTPMGGIVARLAARSARKKGTKVFYTAHGFHFYDGAPLLNWLLYYPIEKWFARKYTDKLILISDADYTLATEKRMNPNTYRIHSVGIDSARYHPFTEEEKQQKRQKLGYSADDFICICTGELNQNKNQAALVQCIPQIILQIPKFKLLLAGNGPKEAELSALIGQLRLENRVFLLGYRTDLQEYLCAADVAVSVSIREGLGINLIEAMACGRPVIGTDNRGHREFIVPGENGLLVPLDQVQNQLPQRIIEVYRDTEMQLRLSKAAEDAAQIYLGKTVECELENIYFG